MERQTRATKTTDVLELLTKGGYAFDSSGKPLLVRKVNPQRLPEMVPEMDIDVDGQTVCKVSETNMEAEKLNLTQTKLGSKQVFSPNETTETLIPRPNTQVRVRPVTAKAQARNQTMKRFASQSTFAVKNKEMHA